MNKVEENIAEIAMYVGHLIAENKLLKSELDLDSKAISSRIVQWAYQFEEKYGDVDLHELDGTCELGDAYGYLGCIDRFTENRLKEMGWLKDSE